jgi:hypothetical protein
LLRHFRDKANIHSYLEIIMNKSVLILEVGGVVTHQFHPSDVARKMAIAAARTSSPMTLIEMTEGALSIEEVYAANEQFRQSVKEAENDLRRDLLAYRIMDKQGIEDDSALRLRILLAMRDFYDGMLEQVLTR